MIHGYHVHHLNPSTPRKNLPISLLKKTNCPLEYYSFINELNTPHLIQQYLKEKLHYHHEDTACAFPEIIKTKRADCFEGGIGFAFPLLYYWGYHPYVVMLHADHARDVDHTLIIYRVNDKIGALAKSNFDMLMDRAPEYLTLHELIETYDPHYISDFPGFTGEKTMIGYSDPINLLSLFGTGWFFLKGEYALQNLYDHFTDNVMCTNFKTKERFLYPPEE